MNKDNQSNTDELDFVRKFVTDKMDSLQKDVKHCFQLPTSAYIEIFEIDPEYVRKEGDDVNAQISENKFQYAPNLLNKKFKIAFSAIQFDDRKKAFLPDNCVELRTNDIGIAPVLRDYNCNGDDNAFTNCDPVDKFQVYIGG